jgi:dipeptidyl-peptidase-4
LLGALLAGVCVAGAAIAQEIPDPGFLEQYASTYRFRLGRPTGIKPAPDGSAVFFLRSGPRSFHKALYEYSVAMGRERVLLSAPMLLRGAEETITVDERARRERRRIATRGITSYQLSKDGRRILVPLSGRLFVLEVGNDVHREVDVGGGPVAVPRLSPDGGRIAYVRAGELFVVAIDRGPPKRLTHDAGGTVTNGLAEFVAQEEMGRHQGFWWSPDSTHLAYQQTDTAGVEILSIMDPTNPQRPPRRSPYPRTGTNNAEVRLGVVAAGGGPTTWVDWDRNRYPYLATVRWDENAPLTILVQNRRQTEEILLEVDVPAGATNPLLVERDDAWVALDQRMPKWLSDGSGFLWTTERAGARQIELRGRDGSLRHAITPVDAALRRLVHLDEDLGVVYTTVSPDPTETHLHRYPLNPDGPPPARLTDTPGGHAAIFSEHGRIFVHTFSGKAGDTWTVRRSSGDVIGRLLSVAEGPSFGTDLSDTIDYVTVGTPALHTVVIRPRDFEAARKYPVIVSVYGGPGGQMVRKGSSRYLFNQWIADHGYVVVSIDGRGTSGRERAWVRAVKGNLIDLPLSDQAYALQELGKTLEYLDLSRVGIYGWSFGGYFSAMAVMRRPEVFHAGVAGAPVVDWLDYDTHYTERYMGLPQDNPSGYEAANVLTWAPGLSRPLLIVHGTADDNVYFMHSLKLADALLRAGRDFELLPLPGFTHMVPDPLITERLYTRIMDFFDEHVKQRR